jgi:NMD protein affecting ribosome stability and mRNA decay
LIESGVQAAEKMGLDIFVSSTKAGRTLYHKVGFNFLGEVIQDDSEWGGDGDYIVAYFSKLAKK